MHPGHVEELASKHSVTHGPILSFLRRGRRTDDEGVGSCSEVSADKLDSGVKQPAQVRSRERR